MAKPLGMGTGARWRLVSLFVILGCASFLGWTRFLRTRPTSPVHPITGRQIPGIATDAGWLDRRGREQQEEPDRALELIGIGPGMVVADVGAGTGYMTMRLARRVGPTGRVYANELQPAMLQIIRDKVKQQQLSNVEIVQGAEEDANLPDGAIDLALLVDVYHELRRPQDMLRSLRRSLKPGGQLVLIEYRKEDPAIPIAYPHRMSVAEVRTEIESEAFTFDRLVPGLPRQHIIEFRR
jgi:SAM-dependent methyltransferase